jgi:hypothetical protein
MQEYRKKGINPALEPKHSNSALPGEATSAKEMKRGRWWMFGREHIVI